MKIDPPRDITIPEEGSTTARVVLSRALGRLVGDLREVAARGSGGRQGGGGRQVLGEGLLTPSGWPSARRPPRRLRSRDDSDGGRPTGDEGESWGVGERDSSADGGGFGAMP